MKIVNIIILIIFFTSFMPLEAFCHDAHDTDVHGHCTLMCQTLISHAVSNQDSILLSPSSKSSVNPLFFEISYQNPSLETLIRPPITAV